MNEDSEDDMPEAVAGKVHGRSHLMKFGKDRLIDMYFKVRRQVETMDQYHNDMRYTAYKEVVEERDLATKKLAKAETELAESKTELAESKTELAETQAELAAKEAELADTKDELADLQAKHARVSADYDKHWAYMQVLGGQLELVRDELNMREESGNHPQELIDRAKAENAEHQAGLDQLLKQGKQD